MGIVCVAEVVLGKWHSSLEQWKKEQAKNQAGIADDKLVQKAKVQQAELENHMKMEFWKPLIDWVQFADASYVFEALSLVKESEVRSLISNMGKERLALSEQLNSMQHGPAVATIRKEV